MGDLPTWKGDLHWNALHHAVDDARDCVTTVFARMEAVDADAKLSAAGKADEKQKIAEAALNSLKKATSLNKARESVATAVAKWDKQSGLTIKPPASADEVALLSEIRRHISTMEGNKVAFVAQHADDPRVVQAVLGGPAFLSGLTSPDIDVIKNQVAKRVAPEVAELKTATLKALHDAEAGWRNATTQIRSRGGLPKDFGNNGGSAE